MSEFSINPLLAYSQHNVVPQDPAGPFPCSISWDMRDATDTAYYIGPKQPLNSAELAQPATRPPLQSLEITCGVFPGDWPIKIYRREGITVGDVLQAIRTTMTHRISRTEWSALSEREQDRITTVFNTRWGAAADSRECRRNGVLRMDCLLQHTLFGGLSIAPKARDSCILSLRRVR